MILHWNLALLNNLSPTFLLVILILLQYCQSLASDCFKLSEKDGPVLFCQACLSQLPLPSSDIPPRIVKLRIIGQSPDNPHNGRLTRYNLSGLETLTYLEIGNFNLQEIESDTFSAMRSLKVLDLSKNKINNIRPGAFNALSLNLLSLTDNKGLVLSRLSFRGAKIYHFVARNCDLHELDYETIAEARPKQISLSDNKIQWLEPRFANLISERKIIHQSSGLPPSKSVSPTSDMSDNQPFHYTWGYLDLTNNPLNCDCQLIWLSRLIEAQLYDSQRYLSSSKDSQSLSDAYTHDTPVRLMHQMNFTCASPSNRIGKRLPRSWEYYCPHPSVVGIDINWLTPNFDMAQLTCTGKGRPAPSLAWTYKVDGQKVQQILDPFAKPYLYGTNPSQGHGYLSDTSSSRSSSTISGPMTEQLSERKLTVNVSLKSLENQNFTCTVWNDDNHYQQPVRNSLNSMDYLSAESTDIRNKHQSSPLIVPSLIYGDSALTDQYRLHEVVLRVIGPAKLVGSLKPPLPVQAAVAAQPNQAEIGTSGEILTKPDNRNAYLSSLIDDSGAKTTVALERVDRDPSYGYLFVKRFTLLELLGAITGTFICTLALLYVVTHCLSWVCQLEPWPVKPSSKPHLIKSSSSTTNVKCLGWFRSPRGSLFKPTHQSGSTSSNTSHGPSDHADSKLLQRHDLETCSSFLNSTGTTNFSKPGSATVAIRHANMIPPALLLTSVPVPPLECSATPPPNPAYWPMPEYTYSGTGSHEYDIPRPLELFNNNDSNNNNSNNNNNINNNNSINNNESNGKITNGKNLVQNGLFELTNDGAHSFINLNNSSQLAHLNNQFQSGGQIASSLSLHWSPVQNSLTLSPQTMIWHSSQNPNSQLSLANSNDLTIPNGTYTATQSMLYATDYPTYLQTRPYPHHQDKPQQPLIDLITNGGIGHHIRPDSNFNGLVAGKQQTISSRLATNQAQLAESDA